MDHFGIGIAITGAAQVCILASKQTGRTTSLLQSLKSGDRVIVPDVRQKEWWLHEAKMRKLEVDVIIVPPGHYHRLMELGTSQGRTLFEHTWVEQHYMLAIKAANVQIDEFQKRLSGWGEEHERTRRQAQEMARWHPFDPGDIESPRKTPR